MSEPANDSVKTYTTAQRGLALGLGLLCHVVFLAAVISMALSLFSGMRIGCGPFRGWAALSANVLLLSFPLLHSWLLSPGGRRHIVHLMPLHIGKELSTTVFALVSGLQLLAIFLLWSPSGAVWWQAQGGLRVAIGIAAITWWAILGKAMMDSQLSLQTGFLGWSAVFRNRPPHFKPFATGGVYRHVRQPIYISYAMLLWLTSAVTPDQLVLAVLWTGYCVAGSRLKEERYLKHFGDAFRAYQQRVPFWLPRPTRRRPDPAHAPPAHVSPGVDVVIAGAGPVGLLLANLLGAQGRSVLVIERRRVQPKGSMAIGVTPPSLDILRSLDLARLFTVRGVPIRTARVFERGEHLGRVDFSRLPSEHRFILSLPQATTVELLRDKLRSYKSVTVVEGIEVVAQRETASGIHVSLRDVRSGAVGEVTASFLAGCDGSRSAVRTQAGMTSRSLTYGCRFTMADFEDKTALGRQAHLYFGPEGSVESFPLPGSRRRWIVQQTAGPADSVALAQDVARRVMERTGFDLSDAAVFFESAFEPAYALATSYARGRVVLCGDAAHVMSPIGGQGMNTGFGDAAHLARALGDILDGNASAVCALRHYTAARRHAFRVAARRAACGMWLGTRTGHISSVLRRILIVGILFRPSMRERLAPYFAMLTIPQDVGVMARLARMTGVPQ